ncbi:Dps family protein [Patiriisocius marinus]|uniref:Dps family protein n=1 Tax=Patiriisocius marinus TaxID=1397112 RepID=UPI00232B98CD|nr:DNA starvation/stationary phase protection protein [Patiriisocius marinus]
MKTLEINIGLNQDYRISVSEKLNDLLADFQIYYMNLRGLHWNIKGKNFFQLHAKFEELYTNSSDTVDEIAERILTLGIEPLHTFQDYLENKSIRVIKKTSSGDDAIRSILENLSELLIQERAILEFAATNNDESTSGFMSDVISEQEKLIWMLTSYLS